MVFNIWTEHNKEQHVCMNTCRSTEETKLLSSFYVKHPQRRKYSWRGMIIKYSNFFLFLLQRVLPCVYHSDPSCLQLELSNSLSLLNRISSEQPDFGFRLQIVFVLEEFVEWGLTSECLCLGTSWQVFFLKREYYGS